EEGMHPRELLDAAKTRLDVRLGLPVIEGPLINSGKSNRLRLRDAKPLTEVLNSPKTCVVLLAWTGRWFLPLSPQEEVTCATRRIRLDRGRLLPALDTQTLSKTSPMSAELDRQA